ncbi:MAG TPA: hypothetical protein VHT52_24075 [Stellaceae bacterium]|nr:hypothetical protein [Stellaceae bacterium]
MSGPAGNKLATSMTSGGGISPQQQAFADYTMGQQSLDAASNFSGSGTSGGIPIGTGETWAAGVAPMVGRAFNEATTSDKDAAAQQSALSSKFSQAGSNVGQLGSLAGGKA